MYNNAQRQEIYKIYVSDALRIITENTAKIAGGGYIKKRYADLVEPDKKTHNNEDNRSAKDIIDDVVNKSGIKVVRS